MNDIEGLLRESLHSAPTPQPRVTDPVATIERRANRARAFIASGAVAAIVVVTAAIVVPLQLANRADGPSRVGPIATEPPSKDDLPQAWAKGNSELVTSGDGFLWNLHGDTASTSGDSVVDKVDPVSHRVLGSWKVAAPADFLAFGLHRVWVWGGGDGGYPDGELQVIDPSGGPAGSLGNRHSAFNGVAFANGKAWATTGSVVWQLRPTDLEILSSTALHGETVQNGIITSETGQLWARTGKSW